MKKTNDYCKVIIPFNLHFEYLNFSDGWLTWIRSLHGKIVILDMPYDRRKGYDYDEGWLVKFNYYSENNIFGKAPSSSEVKRWLPACWLQKYNFEFIGLCDTCGGINRHEEMSCII